MKYLKLVRYLFTAITALLSACTTTTPTDSGDYASRRFLITLAVRRGVEKMILDADQPAERARQILRYAEPIQQALVLEDVPIAALEAFLLDRLPPMPPERRALYSDLIRLTVRSIERELADLPNYEQLRRSRERAALILSVVIDVARRYAGSLNDARLSEGLAPRGGLR